jgi:ABC-type antimicrobial peptide transport system ATPase subunit
MRGVDVYTHLIRVDLLVGALPVQALPVPCRVCPRSRFAAAGPLALRCREAPSAA